MAGELLILDASGSNVDGTDPGTALNLGPGTNYPILEFEAPAPPQTVQWAGSVDTEGALPSSRKHENRTISMKILCVTAASLRTLQDKIGKVAREGGTLKWVLPNAETVIFDLHSADTFAPVINKLLYVRTGGYCQVSITLPARPYGRGAAGSVTITPSSATLQQPFIFTATGIKGDMPALGALRITNATHAKTWVTWGQQSRYYDAATGAALFLEAENGQIGSAALNAGPSGASGGGANKVMRHTNVGTGGTNSYDIKTAGIDLSHIGTFVVLARVQAATANTGVVSIQLSWRPRAFSQVIDNDWVAVADAAGVPVEGSWVIANLGMITVPKARLGTQGWDGNLYAKSTVSTDQIDYDWVALIPVDEGSGVVKTPDLPISSTSLIDINDQGVLLTNNSVNWYDPSESYEGDYLGGSTGIPPAGAEARTLRMIVIVAGATTGGNITDTIVDAVNLDAFSATLTVTPRYLVVPSP